MPILPLRSEAFRPVCACAALLALAVGAIGLPGTVAAQSLYQGAEYTNGTLAEVWELEEEEIERYRELSLVDDAFGAPRRTPYEVLGKHARNAAERSRYAQAYVDMMIDQSLRASEWAIAVQEIAAEHATPLAMVDASDPVERHLGQQGLDRSWYARSELALSEGRVPDALPPAGRATLFVDIDNCAEDCAALWERVRDHQRAGRITGVDIVLVPDGDGERPSRDDILVWAQAREIGFEEVNDKLVTLNHDNESYQAALGNRAVPVALASSGQPIR